MNTQIKPIAIATIALLSTTLTGCCLGGDKCKPPKDAQPDAKYTHLDGSIKRESQRDFFIHKLGEEIGYSGSIDFSETSKNQGFQYTKLIHNGKLSESLNNDSQIEITTEGYKSSIILVGDKGKDGDVIDITLIPESPSHRYVGTDYYNDQNGVLEYHNGLRVNLSGICNGNSFCRAQIPISATDIFNGYVSIPNTIRNYKGKWIDHVRISGVSYDQRLKSLDVRNDSNSIWFPEDMNIRSISFTSNNTNIKNLVLTDMMSPNQKEVRIQVQHQEGVYSAGPDIKAHIEKKSGYQDFYGETYDNQHVSITINHVVATTANTTYLY